MSQLSLADAVLRHAIGFDPFTDLTVNTNYPPHNIQRFSPTHFRVTLAVAGFSAADISVTVSRGSMFVSGKKHATVDEKTGRFVDTPESDPKTYLHRGIALRDFQQVFRIGPNVEVVDASLVDGLLEIDLERQLPEEEKVKTITVR